MAKRLEGKAYRVPIDLRPNLILRLTDFAPVCCLMVHAFAARSLTT